MPRHFLLLPLLLCLAVPSAFGDPALPQPNSPSASQTSLDLLPLKKALAPLDGTGILQSHTTIHMTGTQQGMSVTLREDLEVISRPPSRFHASLTQYDTQGHSQKRLVVVSDGVSVWTYRPGLHQYSVMSQADFKKADSDIPTLGLVIGGFYLGEGRPLVEGFHNITPTNSADVLAVLTGMDVLLSRQTKSVGNQDDYVYSLTLSKQNLAYQFYVNSQTGTLTRVDLAGTQDNTQFSYREDIVQIAPRAAIPKSTFTFVPPLGTTKTPNISINPF